MKKNNILIAILLFSVITLILSFLFINQSKNRYYLIELTKSLETENTNRLNKILEEVSNINIERYKLFYSLVKLYNGEEDEGIKLLKTITNSSLTKEERSIANFLLGEYLLFNKDDSGIPLLLNEDTYNMFSNYINYTIGVYNFEKGNYEESLDFLKLATNVKDNEIKKDILLRISFIQLMKEGKVEENIINEINKLESNKNFVSNLINQIRIFY